MSQKCLTSFFKEVLFVCLGNFHAGEAGSVLKKLDPREQVCFQKLMLDKLKDCVPEYRGPEEKNGESILFTKQLKKCTCKNIFIILFDF